jgi:hypothetical protein
MAAHGSKRLSELDQAAPAGLARIKSPTVGNEPPSDARQTPRSVQAVQKVVELRDDISPSPLTIELVKTMELDPSAVLSQGHNQTSQLQVSSQNNPLLADGLRLEANRRVLKIQWRLWTVAFYLCSDRLEVKQFQHDAHIGLWIDVGAKYHIYTRELGPGCLFFLPDQVRPSA